MPDRRPPPCGASSAGLPARGVTLKEKVIFDGRNLCDLDWWETGASYLSVGRTTVNARWRQGWSP